MARTPRDVTEAELRVLQVLWRQGRITIRTIAEALEPSHADAYYSTVKKLLERLEGKGYVRREPEGLAHVYQALVDRDELVGRRLREVAQSLCEGSLTPLLTQLARHEQLTEEQQNVLLKLIDDLDRHGQKPKRSRRAR